MPLPIPVFKMYVTISSFSSYTLTGFHLFSLLILATQAKKHHGFPFPLLTRQI